MSQHNLVFISVFNYGAIEIALNHLQSLKNQHITNYIAYVTDKESYDAVTERGFTAKLVEKLEESHTKDSCEFGTNSFNELSYIRYKVIHELLLQGKNVWYMDVDTVVLHPSIIHIYESLKDFSVDLACQDDVNMLCSGCMLFFSNEKTIELSEYIYENRDQTSYPNDQTFLNGLLSNNVVNITVRKFDMMKFPNGLLHFNDPNPNFRHIQEQYKNYTGDVLFVHANWMVGMTTKINALKSKNLWFL
jgi:Nucleotide-diphospho-sugar transferase